MEVMQHAKDTWRYVKYQPMKKAFQITHSINSIKCVTLKIKWQSTEIIIKVDDATRDFGIWYFVLSTSPLNAL